MENSDLFKKKNNIESYKGEKMNWKLWTGIGAVMIFLVAGIGITYSHGNKVLEKNSFGIVSATEYWSGEEGQIVARFVDYKGDPMSVINCTANILYPDNSPFITGQLMSSSAIAGDFYTTFTVPATEGIYDYGVTCYYPQGARTKSITSTKTFHVSPALNFLTVINSTQAEILSDIADMQIDVDNIYSDTQYVRSNMVLDSAFQSNMTQINTKLDDIQGDVTTLMTYCDDVVTNASSLCQMVYQMNAQIGTLDMAGLNSQLAEINATTHSTYDYMTVTLAGNINTLLSDTGIIKETTTQINSTVNSVKNDTQTILENQQNEVHLNVIS